MKLFVRVENNIIYQNIYLKVWNLLNNADQPKKIVEKQIFFYFKPVLRNRSWNRNRRNRIPLTQKEPEPDPCSRFRLRFLLQKKISN